MNFDDLYQNGNAANRNHHRTDVNTKKILRACRQFYESKLDQEFNIKMLRRRVNWDDQTEILHYTDAYCKKVFHRDLLQIYGLSREHIANHLAAFLCAKKSLGKQINNNSASQSRKESQKD